MKNIKNNSTSHPVLKNVVSAKKQYSYTLLQGKPVWNSEKGYSVRSTPIQIGSIKSSDGLGECIFNIKFLAENPEFINWRVFKVGVGKYEYERRDDASIKALQNEIKNSKDILDDIKANPSKVGRRPRASVAPNVVVSRKFGDYYLLKVFMDKLDSFKALKKILPQDKYELLEVIVMTCLSKGIKSLSYELEAFVREHGLDLNIPSFKDAIQRLYSYIDENGVIEEFSDKKAKAHVNKLKERIFIALDGTNVDNAGNCLSKAQYGKSKSGSDNKIINFISLVDQQNHELYGVMSYAGNITDVVTVESVCKLLKKKKYKGRISLVCDRGYWSVSNISTMLEYDISFLFNCNISRSNYIKKWVDIVARELIKDRGTTFYTASNLINDVDEYLVGITATAPWSYIQKCIEESDSLWDVNKIKRKIKKLFVHFIFSHKIYTENQCKYRKLIHELNEAYVSARSWQDVISGKEPSKLTSAHTNLLKDGLVTFFDWSSKENMDIEVCSNTQVFYCPVYEKINRICRQMATRVLISDHIDNVIEANERYTQRNNVEVGYSMMKGELGGSTLNASTDKTVNAKIFILALATEVQRKLIETNKTYNQNQIKNEEKEVKLVHNSIRGTLRSLEAVEIIKDESKNSIVVTGGLLNQHINLMESFGIKPLSEITRAKYAKDEGFIKTE